MLAHLARGPAHGQDIAAVVAGNTLLAPGLFLPAGRETSGVVEEGVVTTVEP